MRDVQICFAPDERLMRSISKNMLRADGTLKPQKLRLQISVHRSSHLASAPAPNPKFDGIVEIEVTKVREARTERVAAICVDEPLPENEAHTLIAFVTDHHDGVEDDIVKVRDILAARMVVAQRPTV